MTELLIFDYIRKRYLGEGKEDKQNSTDFEIFSESATVNYWAPATGHIPKFPFLSYQ